LAATSPRQSSPTRTRGISWPDSTAMSDCLRSWRREALGIPVLAGRTFGAEDILQSPRVTIVSQSVASALWPGVNPIGQTIDWNGAPGNRHRRGSVTCAAPPDRGRGAVASISIRDRREQGARPFRGRVRREGAKGGRARCEGSGPRCGRRAIAYLCNTTRSIQAAMV
jgi:hypothetical protein